MPAWRQMSLTGTPASACLRIETIWVSVNFDFFMEPPGWENMPEISTFVVSADQGSLRLDLREKGLARYAFSDIHVFEVMPTKVGLKEFGLERIRTIKEFCGSDHLPSAATLALSELRQACGSEPETEWDEWFPYFEM